MTIRITDYIGNCSTEYSFDSIEEYKAWKDCNDDVMTAPCEGIPWIEPIYEGANGWYIMRVHNSRHQWRSFVEKDWVDYPEIGCAVMLG